MSKGKRPITRNRPSIQTIDRDHEVGSIESDDLCWIFAVSDQTENAANARIGLPVRGSIVGSRVPITGINLLLGFAPQDVGSQIIQAAKRHTRLVGEVVSPNEGSAGSEIWVKLCLK